MKLITRQLNLYYLNRPVKVRIRISGEVINIFVEYFSGFFETCCCRNSEQEELCL